MTKLELKQHTKELYESVIDLLQTKENIELALYEGGIFDDEFIKAQILLISYFHLADVPNKVLETCLDCDIPNRIYEVFYKHIQNEWLKRAYREIGETITEIENMKV